MHESIKISEALARAIHARQIAEHGGDDGIRDADLLASALGRPRNVFAYEGESVDPARLAAAYLYGIVQNHPFVDGNKRVGLVMCGLFLRLNGLRLSASLEDLYAMVMGVATRQIGEREIAKWIRGNLKDKE